MSVVAGKTDLSVELESEAIKNSVLSCHNINECAKPSTCSRGELCVDTAGSYSCKCRAGTTWTWIDDRNKATYYANTYSYQMNNAFDRSTSNWWYSNYGSGHFFLQATFKFTGLICRIRVQKHYRYTRYYGKGFYTAVYKDSQLIKQWKSSSSSYYSYGEPYGSSRSRWLEYPVDKSMFINKLRIGRDGSSYHTQAHITNVEVTFAERY